MERAMQIKEPQYLLTLTPKQGGAPKVRLIKQLRGQSLFVSHKAFTGVKKKKKKKKKGADEFAC